MSHPTDPPRTPSRPLNPRRVLLKHTRHLKAMLTAMVVDWNVRSTTVTHPAGGGNLRLRPRRPDEYPENNLARWQDALQTAHYVVLQADALANFAAEQIRRIEKEKETPSE